MKLYNEDFFQELNTLWRKYTIEKFPMKKRPLIIREDIWASWKRSLALGIDPNDMDDTKIDASLFRESLKKNDDLIAIAYPYMKQLYTYIAGSNHSLQLCSREGYVLKAISGDKLVQELTYNHLSTVQEGFCCAENVTGTNSSGLSLELKRPIQIIGAEHFQKRNHVFCCTSAPILDKNDELLGCLTLMCPREYYQDYSFAIVCIAVDGIQKELRLHQSNRELSLRNHFLNSMLMSQKTGMLLLDEGHNVRYCNNQALRYLKLGTTPVTGINFFDLIQRESFPAHLQAMDVSCSEMPIILKNHLGKSCEITLQLTVTPKENGDSTVCILELKSQKETYSLTNAISGAHATYTFESIKGDSHAMKQVKKQGLHAAASLSNVLIQGESGTGKELMAQAIHNASERAAGPFIAINCGSIPKDLIASELFGYEPGAFTGADKNGAPGKFELANGGTIFLDEIGDMPFNLQVTLLRVLQNREVTRLGSKQIRKVDVRVIAATNRDLQEAISNHTFREDLYYRLNVLNITLPPLRMRTNDISMLTEHLISHYNQVLNKEITEISDDAMSILTAYPWPGNVRELENTIERAINFATSHRITSVDLPKILTQGCGKANSYHETPFPTGKHSADQASAVIATPAPCVPQRYTPHESLEYLRLIDLLREKNGNVKAIAEIIDMPVSTLYGKLNRYGLRPKDFKIW